MSRHPGEIAGRVRGNYGRQPRRPCRTPWLHRGRWRHAHRRAGAAGKEGGRVLEAPDGGSCPCRRDEACRGLGLGRHRARGQREGAQLVRRGHPHGALGGRAMVEVDGVDVGEQQERVGAEVDGEQRGGEVLVDDRFDPGEGSVRRADHGHAAAAGADHEDAAGGQAPDRFQLDDRAGLGRGHDAAPETPVGRDRPSLAGRCGVGGLTGAIGGADRLARSAEGRIGRVDDDLREDGDDLAFRKRVAELLSEDVADHPVGLRAEHVERGQDVARGGLEGEETDLWSVAVGDDQLVIERDRGQRPRSHPRVGAPRRQVGRLAAPQQRIAPEGGDDPHAASRRTGSAARSAVAAATRRHSA
jgi:hypothetical protein